MYKNKFNFRDIVRIFSKKENLKSFNGKKGIVRGISQSEEDPSIFAYAVSILNETGEVEVCKSIFEEDLQSTGGKVDKNTMYSGESVKIGVNPETGEGEIVDDE